MANKIFIPNEIFLEIFQYLPIEDILQNRLTCKRTDELIKNDFFFKYLIKRDFKEKSKNILKDKKINALQYYKKLFSFNKLITEVLNFLETATFSMSRWKEPSLKGYLFKKKTSVKLTKLADSTIEKIKKHKKFAKMSSKDKKMCVDIARLFVIRYEDRKEAIVSNCYLFFPRKKPLLKKINDLWDSCKVK